MTSFSSSPLATVVWVSSAGVWEDFAGFSARLLPQKGLLLRFDRPQVMRRCSRVIWDASEISVSTQPQGEKSVAASLARLRCSPAARPLGAGEALRLRFGGIVEVVQRPPLVSDADLKVTIEKGCGEGPSGDPDRLPNSDCSLAEVLHVLYQGYITTTSCN